MQENWCMVHGVSHLSQITLWHTDFKIVSVDDVKNAHHSTLSGKMRYHERRGQAGKLILLFLCGFARDLFFINSQYYFSLTILSLPSVAIATIRNMECGSELPL